MEENWKAKVYKEKATSEPKWNSKSWIKTHEAVLERDGHKCVCCGDVNNLTVHHIVARESGGTNKQANLETLCVSCHDRIECGEDIRPVIPTKVKDNTGDWHTWVYGGFRNPGYCSL